MTSNENVVFLCLISFIIGFVLFIGIDFIGDYQYAVDKCSPYQVESYGHHGTYVCKTGGSND